MRKEEGKREGEKGGNEGDNRDKEYKVSDEAEEGTEKESNKGGGSKEQ